MKAPILTQFISHFRVIPTDTRAVLLEFIKTIAAPLTTVQLPEPAAFRSDDNYQDSKLDVFPPLNQVYGLPKFKSDSLFHRENGKDTENSCRKKTKGHPSLSPGIFTVYCPHQICYGFSVMRDHESPRVPFNIFRTRFSVRQRQSFMTTHANSISFSSTETPISSRTLYLSWTDFIGRHILGVQRGTTLMSTMQLSKSTVLTVRSMSKRMLE